MGQLSHGTSFPSSSLISGTWGSWEGLPWHQNAPVKSVWTCSRVKTPGNYVLHALNRSLLVLLIMISSPLSILPWHVPWAVPCSLLGSSEAWPACKIILNGNGRAGVPWQWPGCEDVGRHSLRGHCDSRWWHSWICFLFCNEGQDVRKLSLLGIT